MLILVATNALWLTALGNVLIHAEAPMKADIAVVLAGDGFGHRILKAAELAQAGFVPRVLVSGPATFYGMHECDLAIPYAVRKGYPRELFIALPNDCNSTDEEARAVVSELRRRAIKKFLLVTSDYHTARAGRLFRPMATGMEFHTVAAPDEYFTPNGWWRTRPGRKTFALEWLKTITGPLGI